VAGCRSPASGGRRRRAAPIFTGGRRIEGDWEREGPDGLREREGGRRIEGEGAREGRPAGWRRGPRRAAAAGRSRTRGRGRGPRRGLVDTALLGLWAFSKRLGVFKNFPKILGGPRPPCPPAASANGSMSTIGPCSARESVCYPSYTYHI
jgi:hypothetical protein